MEYQNIDKEIYHRSEINRHIRPQYWALVSILLGVGGLIIFLFNPESGLAVGLLGWGGFALITYLLFIFFGDSRVPYHKPSKLILTREYFYYATSSLPQLTAALEANSESQLAAVKRTANPQLVLVRYSDDDEKIVYSQIKQFDGSHETPISNIYTNIFNN